EGTRPRTRQRSEAVGRSGSLPDRPTNASGWEMAVAGRPRLKSVPVHRSDAELVIWPRALQRVYLADPEGSVAALLRLLSEGRYATRDLRAAMAQRGFAVTDREIEGVLS